MIASKFNRRHAALVGCAMAATGCLLAPRSQGDMPHQVAFTLPAVLGSWDRIGQSSLQATELKILQATDHWRSAYQCRETKNIVTVTLVAGAGGPLASHEPDICYARNDFFAINAPTAWTVPEHRDKFRFQTLGPQEVNQPALTIAYAWHDGDRWRAPRIPRLQLGGRTTLQRLQITMRHPNGMSYDARLAVQRFVHSAVDAVDAARSRIAQSSTSSIPPS